MGTVAVIYDERFLEHDTGEQHPETRRRAQWVAEAIRRSPLAKHVTFRKPYPAKASLIERAHSSDYRQYIEEACLKGQRSVDFGETLVSQDSYTTALLSAGAAISAVEAVCNDGYKAAFSCARPPGHHARTEQAMGFCLFNSVAIAAIHAQTALSRERICIIDFDVHHGNGTQECFYATPSVLFISIHQHLLYPQSGWASETGSGQGKGYTLNIPLPPEAGADDYRHAFAEQIEPALRQFSPDLILLSAGFDGHRLDPLSNTRLGEEDFYELTRRIIDLAAKLDPRPPVASILEGGYHPEALIRSALFHLCALAEQPGTDALYKRYAPALRTLTLQPNREG